MNERDHGGLTKALTARLKSAANAENTPELKLLRDDRWDLVADTISLMIDKAVFGHVLEDHVNKKDRQP